jgi:hypothetical protein
VSCAAQRLALKFHQPLCGEADHLAKQAGVGARRRRSGIVGPHTGRRADTIGVALATLGIPRALPERQTGAQHMTQSDIPGANLPYKTLHLSLEVVPGSVRVARGCSRKAARVAASRPGVRTSWSCWTWRRHLVCVDTSAMQANQRPWSCCSRMSFEILGFSRLSCTISTVGFPEFPVSSRSTRSTDRGNHA